MNNYTPETHPTKEPGTDPTNIREKIYDEQINPLVLQIQNICRENGIPYMATFEASSPSDLEEGKFHMITSAMIDSKKCPVPIEMIHAFQVLVGDRRAMPTFAEFMEMQIAAGVSGNEPSE